MGAWRCRALPGKACSESLRTQASELPPSGGLLSASPPGLASGEGGVVHARSVHTIRFSFSIFMSNENIGLRWIPHSRDSSPASCGPSRKASSIFSRSSTASLPGRAHRRRSSRCGAGGAGATLSRRRCGSSRVRTSAIGRAGYREMLSADLPEVNAVPTGPAPRAKVPDNTDSGKRVLRPYALGFIIWVPKADPRLRHRVQSGSHPYCLSHQGRLRGSHRHLAPPA